VQVGGGANRRTEHRASDTIIARRSAASWWRKTRSRGYGVAGVEPPAGHPQNRNRHRLRQASLDITSTSRGLHQSRDQEPRGVRLAQPYPDWNESLQRHHTPCRPPIGIRATVLLRLQFKEPRPAIAGQGRQGDVSSFFERFGENFAAAGRAAGPRRCLRAAIRVDHE